ncbi:MAG TPA: hypothetical protein PLW86_12550 [Rhodocyclaceae bacterium]|nr:hypothetical protein [Rhodocyclaceae bacterium]
MLDIHAEIAGHVVEQWRDHQIAEITDEYGGKQEICTSHRQPLKKFASHALYAAQIVATKTYLRRILLQEGNCGHWTTRQLLVLCHVLPARETLV